jgi:hypothetical protein
MVAGQSALFAVPAAAQGHADSPTVLDKPVGGCQGEPMSGLLSDEETTRRLGDPQGWWRGGVTQLDIELAHRISAAAARPGAVTKETTT